jgi:hypothetical protein
MTQTIKRSTPQARRRRKAGERMRGIFAGVAPGISLADELIADRRAEVRAEELAADAERRKRAKRKRAKR